MRLKASEEAYLAILALASKPELRRDAMIGGKAPPEMLAANKRKEEEHRRQKFAIIAKFGVFDEYLKPLRATEKRFEQELESVRRDIADLEKLRTGA